MTKKILGASSGTGVNHIHSEVPVILIHNKNPFASREEALTAIAQKAIRPGELVVAYYTDPGADDGMTTLLVAGPLVQGGKNKIFKDAEEIDQLAAHLSRQIEAQDEFVHSFAEELKVEIDNMNAEFLRQMMEQNQEIMARNLAEEKELIDASFQQMRSDFENEFIPLVQEVADKESEDVSTLTQAVLDCYDSFHASDASLKNEFDASICEVIALINESGQAIDSSIKEYVDMKDAELRMQMEITASDIRSEMRISDNSIGHHIDASYSDLDIRLRSQDSRQTSALQAETAERIEQCNAVRTDLKSDVDELNSSLSQYIDGSVARVRREYQHEDEVLGAELSRAFNTSLNALEAKEDAAIVALNTSVGHHIDDAYADLHGKMRTYDSILKTDLEDEITEGDASVFSVLDTKIDDSYAALETKLRDEDASLYNTLNDKINNTKIELTDDYVARIAALKSEVESDIQNEDSSLKEYSDNQDASILNYLNIKISDVDANNKAYTDASVSRLRQEVNRDINDLSINISNHFDASITEINTQITNVVNEVESDVAGNVSILNSKIVTLENYVDEQDASVLAETKAYTDASINALKAKHNADVSILYADMNTLVSETAAALDSSFEGALASESGDIRAAYAAADAQLEADLESELSSLGQDINARIDREVSTLAGSFEDRIQETENILAEDISISAAAQKAYTDVEIQKTSQEIANLETSVNSKIVSERSEIDEEINDLVSKHNTDIATLDASVAQHIDSSYDALELRISQISSDTSAIDIALDDLKAYTDASINKLRNETADSLLVLATEINETIADVSSEMSSRIAAVADDASNWVSDLKEETDEVIEIINSHINASVAEINEDVAEKFLELTKEDASIKADVAALDASNVEEHIALWEAIQNTSIYIDTQVSHAIAIAESQLEEAISELDSSVDDAINALEDILTQDVSALKVKDVSLAAGIAANAEAISSNTDVISQNTSDIEGIRQEIVELNTTDVSLANSIAANNELIEQNISDIQDSREQIELNKADIDSNTADISTLFGAVENLSEKDETIDGEIRELAHQISDVSENHAADISVLYEKIAEIIGDASSEQVSLNELDRRLTIAEDNIADVSSNLEEETEIRLEADTLIENHLAELKRDSEAAIADVSSDIVSLSESTSSKFEQVASEIEALDASIKEAENKAEAAGVYAEQLVDELREEIGGMLDTSVRDYVDLKFNETKSEIAALDASVSDELNLLHNAQEAYEEHNAIEHAAIYEYIDASVDILNSKIDALDASLSEEIEFLESTDASLNARINALGEYVDINLESITSDISTLDGNIVWLSNEVDALSDNTQSKIEALDASVKELFDVINKISIKLGLDEIPDASISIIPTIIDTIEQIVESEMEWRILDGSVPYDPSLPYDPSWRDLSTGNEDDDNMISQANLRDLNNQPQTIDSNSEEQLTSSNVRQSNNGVFNSWWRNLGD